MAQIKVEDIVDHLSTEFRKALAATIRQTCPGATFDEHQAYRTFKREVYRACSVWENVPDNLVQR